MTKISILLVIYEVCHRDIADAEMAPFPKNDLKAELC